MQKSSSERVLGALSAVSMLGATLVLAANVCVVMYGVVMRYLAGGAPIWTDELARFTMIGTAMLAAAAVWVRGEHMRVSLAERFLPAYVAIWVVRYQWFLALALALGGAYATWRYAQSVSMFRSQGLGVSRTIPLLSMPIGFALLALVIALRGAKPLPRQVGEGA